MEFLSYASKRFPCQWAAILMFRFFVSNHSEEFCVLKQHSKHLHIWTASNGDGLVSYCYKDSNILVPNGALKFLLKKQRCLLAHFCQANAHVILMNGNHVAALAHINKPTLKFFLPTEQPDHNSGLCGWPHPALHMMTLLEGKDL